MVKTVQESFRIKAVTPDLNKSFIVLIPKIRQPNKFSNFTHISLCNFYYKIISKILVNWLKPFLNRFISPNQGAFVEGRWIAENMVIAQEIVHKVKNYKGKDGLMIIKLDL